MKMKFIYEKLILIFFQHIRLVIDALKEVNKDRTCFRLIGGILVQQTVDNVLPDLEKNFDMVCEFI